MGKGVPEGGAYFFGGISLILATCGLDLARIGVNF